MNHTKFTGSRNVALGVDTKIIPSGLCSNSNIIPCVFCRDGNCYFAGECENKKITKV